MGKGSKSKRKTYKTYRKRKGKAWNQLCYPTLGTRWTTELNIRDTKCGGLLSLADVLKCNMDCLARFLGTCLRAVNAPAYAQRALPRNCEKAHRALISLIGFWQRCWVWVGCLLGASECLLAASGCLLRASGCLLRESGCSTPRWSLHGSYVFFCAFAMLLRWFSCAFPMPF